MPSAHVHPHNGTPTLFLNGEPVYAAMHWLAGGFDPDGSYQNDYAVREFARSGVHMNAVGIAPAWCGAVAPSTPDADLEEAGRLLRAVLAADPQALFHLRIYLESGSWFNERFPTNAKSLPTDRGSTHRTPPTSGTPMCSNTSTGWCTTCARRGSTTA